MNEKNPKKPPRLKVGEFPWWIENYAQWWIYGVGILLCTAPDLLQGRFDRVIIAIVGLPMGVLLLHAIGRLVDKWIIGEAPPKKNDLPAPVCPKCGYDLRANLMRCPECGSESPFKQWLDKQHPLERIMLQRALEKQPHQPQPDPEPDRKATKAK